MAGGWYDQHPKFVDAVQTILAIQAEVEETKQQRQSKQKARQVSM